MPIRFTGFMKYAEKDISLYVVQEDNEYGNPCFRVRVKKGEDINTEIWKKNGSVWEISSQDLPNWVSQLKDRLVHLIESRMSEFKN